MLKIIGSRLAALLAVMLAVSVLVFAMGSLIPGDMTSVIVGQEGATKAQFDRVRRDLGLDRPLPVQYVRWLGNALQGDLGKSPITGREVSADLASQIPVSLELALLCLLFSTLIGLPAGIVAAVHANRRLDVAIRTVLLLIVLDPGVRDRHRGAAARLAARAGAVPGGLHALVAGPLAAPALDGHAAADDHGADRGDDHADDAQRDDRGAVRTLRHDRARGGRAHRCASSTCTRCAMPCRPSSPSSASSSACCSAA